MVQEQPMSDLLLKVHGAHAFGTISPEEHGQYRASLLIRDASLEHMQQRGPEFFDSENAARRWISSQARIHGFGSEDFQITLEKE
jgi:hypothetical protein